MPGQFAETNLQVLIKYYFIINHKHKDQPIWMVTCTLTLKKSVIFTNNLYSRFSHNIQVGCVCYQCGMTQPTSSSYSQKGTAEDPVKLWTQEMHRFWVTTLFLRCSSVGREVVFWLYLLFLFYVLQAMRCKIISLFVYLENGKTFCVIYGQFIQVYMND